MDKVVELVGGVFVINGAYLNPSQEGYYNSINPLVEGVPHILTGLHLWRPHIHKPRYSGASSVSHTSFTVVQFIGLQYSVLAYPV